jgi:hypothetical protein
MAMKENSKKWMDRKQMKISKSMFNKMDCGLHFDKCFTFAFHLNLFTPYTLNPAWPATASCEKMC